MYLDCLTDQISKQHNSNSKLQHSAQCRPGLVGQSIQLAKYVLLKILLQTFKMLCYSDVDDISIKFINNFSGLKQHTSVTCFGRLKAAIIKKCLKLLIYIFIQSSDGPVNKYRKHKKNIITYKTTNHPCIIYIIKESVLIHSCAHSSSDHSPNY